MKTSAIAPCNKGQSSVWPWGGNYTPITVSEILAMRSALPGIVAWLRAREGK